ncbi:hypothetical protein [Bradyrhizobium sp. WSM2254]|uniref:hypothetical protein n=1 Tax=Bradyrhizobium sp. WSM2254 TaxID=1188263 RepID=UPI0004168F0B|nr:hypothetical protein [Bradyrhizobium sp. WSM2254]
MTKEVTRQATDLYEKYASEAVASGGPRMKFVKGKFKIGDEPVASDTEFIVLMADIAQAWTRFEGGKATNELLYRLADGFEPHKREELGDPQETWPFDNGRPKDPWSLQWKLPMQNVKTGDAAIFTTDTVGGSQAVKALIKEYHRRRNTGSLPIIALKSRSYSNEWGVQHVPVFHIVRWTTPTSELPPTAPATDVNASAVKSISDKPATDADDPKNEMGDDIPF